MNALKLKWFGSKRRSNQPQPWHPHSSRVFHIALAGLVIGLLTYLSPYQRPYNVAQLRVGSVSQERIEAPFLFNVPKSDAELEHERQAASAEIPTILHRDPLIQEQQLAQLDSVFVVMIPRIRVQMANSFKQRELQRALPQVVGSLSLDALSTLIDVLSTASQPYVHDFQAICRQILANYYTAGIIASKQPILLSPSTQVRLGDREQHVETLYSEEKLKQGELISHIQTYHTIADRNAVQAVHELLSLFVVPNLTIDEPETAHLRDAARRGVASIKRIYAQNDLIIDKNATVTEEHVDALDALAARIAQDQSQHPIKRLIQMAAAATISGLLIFVFGYFLATHERAVFDHPGQLVLLAILTVATAVASSYIKTHDLSPYWVPIPLAAMLATILLTPQIGLVLSFVLALFVGNLFADFYVVIICALTAAIAVYAVRHVRHRNQFYRPMIFLPVSYALLIAAADLLRFFPVEQIYDHILPGIVIGVAAPILTIGLLPIFESLFHITTDITLLELSDPNRTLLRQLAVRAPGTYTHSLIMANLSESAAEAITANPLLARVGCYYHDIGKVNKPEYFSENQGLQGGRNPHDRLMPYLSMLIIASHVREGLELAEEHGLPQSICDLIAQHHGTTVIEYFYERAVELGDRSVREEDFRYHGPKPQTKEAGILMLADSVEAAARTLAERTPSRMRQLVHKIIQQKFTAGELDECALTLRDLLKIEDSFIRVLMGVLHSRMAYPWQKANRKWQTV
ncbi:MAG: HDIG domain-containing protein [Candidatus Latescibacteria bacterium]|nr:HDIG domain-containing protein [Candidatus Latescibacterota bacterium]